MSQKVAFFIECVMASKKQLIREVPVTTFRVEELKNFVIAGEKSYPPVFVGRKPILDEIFQKSILGFEQGTAPSGNARIIQGAPGAGKTSILLELERCGQQGNYAPRTVVVTNVEIEQHLSYVLKSIAMAASAPRQDWIKTITHMGSYVGTRLGEISVLGFSTDFARLVESSHPKDLYELGKVVPSSKWVHPVILAVDEAQRLRGGKSTFYAQCLQSIHDAHQIRLPLTLVFAGLGDTQERVNELGITNGAYAFPVGALNAQEQAQVIDGFCDHFGLQVGRQHDRLHAFFEPTDGWPRHLYWAQRALAEVLLDPAVDGHFDNIADWTLVEQRRDQFRLGYYEDRTSSTMKMSNKLVGALMRSIDRYEQNNQHLTLSAIANILKKCAQRGHDDEAWLLPDNQTARSYIRHLIHQGALAEDITKDTFVCPIPSFQTHLIERARFKSEELSELDHMISQE